VDRHAWGSVSCVAVLGDTYQMAHRFYWGAQRQIDYSDRKRNEHGLTLDLMEAFRRSIEIENTCQEQKCFAKIILCI